MPVKAIVGAFNHEKALVWAKSSRTFVWSSRSQPKHLHLLTPITAQFAARARPGAGRRSRDPWSAAARSSAAVRRPEQRWRCLVRTRRTLAALDTASQHQSLSGRPAAGDLLWWCQSNSSLWESHDNENYDSCTLFEEGENIPWQKFFPRHKSRSPVFAIWVVSAVNWLPETRGSSAVPQQEPEQLFYDKSAILLLVTATQSVSSI